jgi:hypothetical protein
MWGNLLDAAGGLDTLMKSLTVFIYRQLWGMIERDLGREATLRLPLVKVLFVGGSPPVDFVRAIFPFMSDHYPGALTHVVNFGTPFRGVLFKMVSNVLPQHVAYSFASKRVELFEILNADAADLKIPDAIMYTNVSFKKQLIATAAIDQEWLQELWEHGYNLCAQNPLTVKNTFVELTDDPSPIKTSRRHRAYSSDDVLRQESPPDSSVDPAVMHFRKPQVNQEQSPSKNPTLLVQFQSRRKCANTTMQACNNAWRLSFHKKCWSLCRLTPLLVVLGIRLFRLRRACGFRLLRRVQELRLLAQ